MKIRIHPILAALLTLSAALPIQAESEAMPTYELKSFVVVAPNLWTPEAHFARESIASAKPVDLAAILSSKLPAAALTRKGPLAGDIVLRGFSRDNVSITVDNNKTFCACPNRMDPPAFHVSSQQIEAISVRTGPFSVDQGASLGGQIAVRTSEPTGESFGRFHGYYGSFGYSAFGATGGAKLSDSLNLLGGVYYQQGGVYEDGSGTRITGIPGLNYQPGFQNGDAFKVFNTELKAAYTFDHGGALTLSYALQDASDVLYPGLMMDAPEDRMNRAAIAYGRDLNSSLADRLEASLAISLVEHDMRDSFRTSINNMGGVFVPRGYFMRTEATSTYLGARLNFSKSYTDDSLLRYGFDLNRREWDANNIIGMQRNDMLPDTVTDTGGIWTVFEHRQEGWSFESGLRLDLSRSKAREDISFVQAAHGTATNSQTDVLPSAYVLASRELNTSLEGYAGLGFASRVPDTQERYMNLNRPMANPDWVGNPDLDPVQNLELQGGLRWQKDAWDAEVSAFHSWLGDYIYLQQLSPAASIPGGATSYANIDARIYGFSAKAGWDADEHLRLEAGVACQKGVKGSRPTNATNNVLGEVPPLRARLAALFNYKKLTTQAELQFQSDLDRIDPDLNERPIDGWAVLNLAASYQFSDAFSLSVGIDNVLDKNYAVANSFVRDPFSNNLVINEPGRFLFVRAGFQF